MIQEYNKGADIIDERLFQTEGRQTDKYIPNKQIKKKGDTYVRRQMDERR